MSLSIGQLAKAAEVPTSTVRYYERIGLLEPDGRTGGNYRYYSDAALRRLRFIRAAHAAGFTLDDVAALLNMRKQGAEPCGQVRELLEKRLSDIQQRIEDLHGVERVVLDNLDLCRKAERDDPCHVVDKLKVAAGGGSMVDACGCQPSAEKN